MPLDISVEEIRMIVWGSLASLGIIVFTILVLGVTMTFLGSTGDTNERDKDQVPDQIRDMEEISGRLVGFYIRRSIAQYETEECLRQQIRDLSEEVAELKDVVEAMTLVIEEAHCEIILLRRALRETQARHEIDEQVKQFKMAAPRSTPTSNYSIQDQSTQTRSPEDDGASRAASLKETFSLDDSSTDSDGHSSDSGSIVLKSLPHDPEAMIKLLKLPDYKTEKINYRKRPGLRRTYQPTVEEYLDAGPSHHTGTAQPLDRPLREQSTTPRSTEGDTRDIPAHTVTAQPRFLALSPSHSHLVGLPTTNPSHSSLHTTTSSPNSNPNSTDSHSLWTCSCHNRRDCNLPGCKSEGKMRGGGLASSKLKDKDDEYNEFLRRYAHLPPDKLLWRLAGQSEKGVSVLEHVRELGKDEKEGKEEEEGWTCVTHNVLWCRAEGCAIERQKYGEGPRLRGGGKDELIEEKHPHPDTSGWKCTKYGALYCLETECVLERRHYILGGARMRGGGEPAKSWETERVEEASNTRPFEHIRLSPGNESERHDGSKTPVPRVWTKKEDRRQGDVQEPRLRGGGGHSKKRERKPRRADLDNIDEAEELQQDTSPSESPSVQPSPPSIYLLPNGTTCYFPLSIFDRPWHHPGYKAPPGRYLSPWPAETKLTADEMRREVNIAYAGVKEWESVVRDDPEGWTRAETGDWKMVYSSLPELMSRSRGSASKRHEGDGMSEMSDADDEKGSKDEEKGSKDEERDERVRGKRGRSVPKPRKDFYVIYTGKYYESAEAALRDM